MNTATAASHAGVTTSTIAKWCRSGAIAAIKQAGRWIIDTASLAYRIKLPTLLKATTEPSMDLNNATYTHTYVNDTQPTVITPQIKTRVRNGKTITIVTGLAALLADHLDAMPEYDRLHTLEVLRMSGIYIYDTGDEIDETGHVSGGREWADYGRLATTYYATRGLPVSVVLDLAAQIRTALNAQEN